MSEENLPREIGRAILNIEGLELEVVNLDNGQRILTEESMAKILEWLDSGWPVIEGKQS